MKIEAKCVQERVAIKEAKDRGDYYISCMDCQSQIEDCSCPPDTNIESLWNWPQKVPEYKGNLIMKNQDNYQGEWQDGLKHGYGMLHRDQQGEFKSFLYYGYFYKGLQEGEGKLMDRNKTLHGIFLAGKMSGLGIQDYHHQNDKKFKNSGQVQQTYYGDVLLGYCHGYGVTQKKDGSKFCGRFENSKLVEEAKSGSDLEKICFEKKKLALQ